MPRSMTGFGTADGAYGNGRVTVDVRSVNHRHLQVQCRMPSVLQGLEPSVRARVRDRVRRGHVTVAVAWAEEPEQATTFRVDVDRARAMRDALRDLADGLGIADHVDLGFYARRPDVLVPVDASGNDADPEALLCIVDAAVDGLLASRETEGAALRDALVASLEVIEREMQAVAERAPHRVESERKRLRERIAELLDGKSVPEDRIELEIALLADKLDIAEELVRLQTHVVAARQALGGTDPVGKRLGFLNQEMLREINTMGSKANDAEITRSVIEMKTELEKIREQVENLE